MSLADEMKQTAVGQGHWRKIRLTGNFTFAYLKAAGSRVSADKSALFSTSPSVRAAMRLHRWPSTGAPLLVRLHARDLGAHVTYALRLVSGTLSKRVRDVMPVCDRLRTLPSPADVKARALRGKVLPAALYSCENTPVTKVALRALAAAMKRALAVGNNAMSSAFALFATWRDKSPDPVRFILLTRVRALRRAWHSSSDLSFHLNELVALLFQDGNQCLVPDMWEPTMLAEGILHNVPWERASPSEAEAGGPLGLALMSLASIGARLDCEWNAYAEFMPVFNVIHDSWPYVRSCLDTLFLRSALAHASASRASLKQHSVDWRASLQHKGLTKQQSH